MVSISFNSFIESIHGFLKQFIILGIIDQVVHLHSNFPLIDFKLTINLVHLSSNVQDYIKLEILKSSSNEAFLNSISISLFKYCLLAGLDQCI